LNIDLPSCSFIAAASASSAPYAVRQGVACSGAFSIAIIETEVSVWSIPTASTVEVLEAW
jgi:hypothetical protein